VRRTPIDAALNLLAVRARAKGELDRALKDRGYDEAERAQALGRLAELGYLDDTRFGKERALGMLRSGRFGPTAVVQRLMRHGLPSAAAKEALEAARGELGFDPLASARELLGRKRRGPLDDPKARARAMRLLVGRGFSLQVARQAVGSLDRDGEED
jgi:regulatory protein